jgi:DNA-directed RNA polymerase specialized sigma24 family protein
VKPTIAPVETWSAAECAEAWGVRPGTWAGYVSRGQAPAPLPDTDPKRWSAAAVRDFARPGVGRSRSGAGPEAQALLAEMTAVAERMEDLRATQRRLLEAGRDQGLEISPMAEALGISRQTAYSWLK